MPPPPPALDPTQPMVPLDPLTPDQHLLSTLVEFPTTGKIGHRAATKIQMACALLSALARGSEKAKGVARMIVPGESKPPAPEANADSDDLPRLVSVLIGNMHLALRECGQNNRRACDRVIVSLLMAPSSWMWDSPPSVCDFFGTCSGNYLMAAATRFTLQWPTVIFVVSAFPFFFPLFLASRFAAILFISTRELITCLKSSMSCV
ncbi:hypothetical protein RSOLAG22IIIB_05704 [Rhizoctonia solani]|uniref:Uncharacterized protein n=1 Tax=Rhizoctonia solani TaxID=456999 RepID=A0A0K6G8S0_9AGAM|nr:hypothetical protein RSOLAG22IIIB_05704 [Rhizoctonia solani]